MDNGDVQIRASLASFQKDPFNRVISVCYSGALPALLRILALRIRKSIKARGVLGTIRCSIRAPWDVLNEWRIARRLYSSRSADAFDLQHNVETSQRVHPADMRVNSANWAYGTGYIPTASEIVSEIFARLPISDENFTFVDLGSGKGRVLLMASEYPFRQIVGVEYAPELHATAVNNVRTYRSPTQKCKSIECCCGDIAEFIFPDDPLVVFLFNPAQEAVIELVATHLIASVRQNPRQVWVIYVNPVCKPSFSAFPLAWSTDGYAVYRALAI